MVTQHFLEESLDIHKTASRNDSPEGMWQGRQRFTQTQLLRYMYARVFSPPSNLDRNMKKIAVILYFHFHFTIFAATT